MSLYQLGAVTIDTRPFNAEGADRDASADFAVKPLIGSMPGREFMGEGDDELKITGQLLPSKVGGLSELEALHGFRRGGQRLPVMRGDGRMLGWFVITSISERHTDLNRDGVGFLVGYTISMFRTSPEGASPAIIGSLLSLFGALA
ncbi:phage tail protein [Terrihabitans rhizophilus]|uniref:Phage tail protein n=1 Tax=Terrihabitans rhizophilus TaxID=3092662 RepID=A0ABU4RN87_9HYPH|nr:phage tail protein [Terrihabitans sp. PJ23]MDX6806300.1 phage tail protein [Terrihabitans sp. PJ23]